MRRECSLVGALFDKYRLTNRGKNGRIRKKGGDIWEYISSLPPPRIIYGAEINLLDDKQIFH